jgi:hypothetical protein
MPAANPHSSGPMPGRLLSGLAVPQSFTPSTGFLAHCLRADARSGDRIAPRHRIACGRYRTQRGGEPVRSAAGKAMDHTRHGSASTPIAPSLGQNRSVRGRGACRESARSVGAVRARRAPKIRSPSRGDRRFGRRGDCHARIARTLDGVYGVT